MASVNTASFSHTASLSILLLQGRDDGCKAGRFLRNTASILVTVLQGERRKSELGGYLEETGDS